MIKVDQSSMDIRESSAVEDPTKRVLADFVGQYRETAQAAPSNQLRRGSLQTRHV